MQWAEADVRSRSRQAGFRTSCASGRRVLRPLLHRGEPPPAAAEREDAKEPACSPGRPRPGQGHLSHVGRALIALGDQRSSYNDITSAWCASWPRGMVYLVRSTKGT